MDEKESERLQIPFSQLMYQVYYEFRFLVVGWTMTKTTILFLTFICLHGLPGAFGQSRQQSPDMAYRAASNEDGQTSLAEWKTIPAIELVCIARALNQQGQKLESMLLNGTSPLSPSLIEVRAKCKIKSGNNSLDETVAPK
jgi:hypothetical protein